MLDIFEAKYPADKRPRLALEAVDAFIKDPSEDNKAKCRAAAYAANAANAAAYAAAYAANAAYAAAYAANAANAAAYAANAAYDAADAANAAYAADAARAQQKEVNLIFLVEIYQEKK